MMVRMTLVLSMVVVSLLTTTGELRALPINTITVTHVDETFDTNTADASTDPAYSAFSFVTNSAGTLTTRVEAQALQLRSSGHSNGPDGIGFQTDQTFNHAITVAADSSRLSGPPSSNPTGISIGNRAFVYFPNFATGAFRIYDFNPVTATIINPALVNNQDMGFDPVFGTFYRFEIESDNLGGFTGSVTNVDDALETYNFTYSDGSYVPGPVGFLTALTNTTSIVDAFDNLLITSTQPVPEPSTGLLMLAGLVLLGKYRRRRKS